MLLPACVILICRLHQGAVCTWPQRKRIEAPTDVLLRVTSALGAAVACVQRADRVTVPTHICCGFCLNCVRGYTDACLTTNPGAAGAAYGYPRMGAYRGAQTELVWVPFADANCVRLPGEPGDDWEHDFVLLADAFPTGTTTPR